MTLSPDDELAQARQIQELTYPSRIPGVDGFEVFARTAPASWGNGDFYDAIGVKPRKRGPGYVIDQGDCVEHLVLTLGDATGHGMGAALMATALRSMLRASIRLGAYHRDLAAAVNAQLVEDLDSRYFITLLMGRLEPALSLFRWVSFGQGPIWHYRAGPARVERLEPHAPPLGILSTLLPYEPTETAFEPGDVLLALSDGFAETRDAAGELYGETRLAALFAENAALPGEAMYRLLWAAVETHAGGLPQADDRTLLLIRRC